MAKMQKRNKEQGVILLIAVVVLSILLTMSAALVGYTVLQVRIERLNLAQGQALALAEAGIDKAIDSINTTPSYTGETGTVLGPGQFTISINSIDSNTKQITSTAYVPNSTSPKATRIVKTNIALNTTAVAFNFGVQVGAGGLNMNNNSKINGNVYSNGDITGSGTVTGNATVAGGTSPSADQIWTTNDRTVNFANASATSDIAQSFIPSASNVLNKISVYIAKVGAPTDITIKILSDNSGSPSKTVLATGTIAASTITTTPSFIDGSFSTTPSLAAGTKYWILFDATVNASNYFIVGQDSADGYTSGTSKSSTNWNASTPVWSSYGGDLNFKTWMGGVVTQLNGVSVNGTAKANTLKSCSILGNAYYASTNTCTVGGTSYSGQTDPAPQSMPVSDAQISDWEDTASSGGVISGSYTVSGTVTMGPKEINGDLTINGTLNLTGPVWVNGNVIFSNNSSLTIDSSLGNAGATLIADKPTNISGSGTITVNNNVTFSGNGNTSSYPLLVSTNTSGSAITLNNNANGAIFYAGNGTINVGNNVSATQLTGYKIQLNNNAIITYSTGLASSDFSDGPGGSWQFSSGSYFISK